MYLHIRYNKTLCKKSHSKLARTLLNTFGNKRKKKKEKEKRPIKYVLDTAGQDVFIRFAFTLKASS